MKRLTLHEKRAHACYCPKDPSKGVGWTVDPVTRRGICSSCGNPCPQAIIRTCMICTDEFILPLDDPTWRPLYEVSRDGKRTVMNEFMCHSCY